MRALAFLTLFIAVGFLVLFSAAMLLIGGYWLAAAIIGVVFAALVYPCLAVGAGWAERRHGDSA